jgi:hypothetical protein
MIEQLAPRLLRRGVRHGAEEFSGSGDALRDFLIRSIVHGCVLPAVAPSEFGETEIQNLDPLAINHKQVGRFDIAVNYAALVRCLQSIRDLDAEGDGLL